MTVTPASKPNFAQMRTPQSKHRLNFAGTAARNPNSALREIHPAEHPVEVVGRIRNHPDQKEDSVSFLNINPDKKTVRLRADFGYRDFTLDGISSSEDEDLEGFYNKFVQSRIQGVKLGAKCTIMMYGPTGSGKSHSMFGCGKLPGIVYRSLRDILGDKEEYGEGNSEKSGIGTFVQVTVLEIYNEEIYDLLSNNDGGGFRIGWPKGGSGSNSKVKLEVMGKKAKNATSIFGTEAGKISKEIQKVEKRRVVKSTLCNDRSSRSHCMIILDVPTVGGRLMLVDMAGSENIEQAGQVGFEAKMQTGKINQGNIALKRVVESIANGDSHVPFRDSKLTMLLQDSFQDDKSKILMILCASPDPKEMHKTLCTFEYGAKAKCIIRGPHTPDRTAAGNSSSVVILGSKVAAMDEFISKLQMETKLREKERNEAHNQLMKKEEEVAGLRALLEGRGSSRVSEEEINLQVNERTEMLKRELERKLDECKRMAEEFVEIERRRMEERIVQQQEEVEMLRRRLLEIEFELKHSKDSGEQNERKDMEGISIAKKLFGIYGDEEPGMVKSMDLDMGDQESFEHRGIQGVLSTVYELEEEGEDEEVEKVIIEEKRVCSSRTVESVSPPPKLELIPNQLDPNSARQTRLQNIFTLCGNHRELSQHIKTPPVPMTTTPDNSSLLKCANKENLPVKKFEFTTNTEQSPGATKVVSALKENQNPLTPLENMMSSLTPTLSPHLSSTTPFITLRRRR